MRFWLVMLVGVLLFGLTHGVRRMMVSPQPQTPAVQSPADTPATPPQRIISLSPGITEVLFAVGAGNRVVGVTNYCAWPAEALDRPKVGGFLDPNYEAMVALRPDLVLLMPSHRDHRAELERLGLRYEVVDQTRLEDIRASILTIGALCGKEELARGIETELARRVEVVKTRAAALPRPRVLLSSGRDLRSGTLNEVYIVGPTTFLGNLLALAGGENVFTDTTMDYPALSGEAILRLNPEVIVEFTNGIEAMGVSREQVVAAWKALPGLAAAESGRIAVLDGAYLTIPGPRVADTLEALAAAIHPEWGDAQ